MARRRQVAARTTGSLGPQGRPRGPLRGVLGRGRLPTPQNRLGVPGKPGGPVPFLTPTDPPGGTYDPALDAQERAATRGLGDLRQDTETGGERSLSDYLLARGELERQRAEGAQDYGRTIAGIDRSYGQLARRQAEGQRASGNRGGALAAALARRQENQAIDRAPVDINYQRMNQGVDRRLGAMGVDYQRGTTDRTNTLARAERENAFFGQDVSAQRWYQAKGTGYVPPLGPGAPGAPGGPPGGRPAPKPNPGRAAADAARRAAQQAGRRRRPLYGSRMTQRPARSVRDMLRG